MDRLADEVLQLVFNEIDRPAAFAAIATRYRAFSQDAYVRARYLLARHGVLQAFFVALGRPSITNERVLDVLLTARAHISRYLVQLAVQHYFRTPVSFIKHPWVKLLPLPVFTHFLNLATTHLGDFSTAKGEDDGTLFHQFVKEGRAGVVQRTITVDVVAEMFQRYKFIPFCDKDPITAQFPLALALEPSLLPLAVANGFRMDSSYRDYVFRRMFERTPAGATPDAHARHTVDNVRELCRLDPSMFVSRTVAAEVCMEAQVNPAAYSALKLLDRASVLRFDLSALVRDLIKSFATTRSITSESAASALHHLYADALRHDHDPTIRRVLLLSVFASCPPLTPAAAHTRLQSLGLTPLSRADVARLMLSPFVDAVAVLSSYAAIFMGMGEEAVEWMVRRVAIGCLEVASKGNTLKAILKREPATSSLLESTILSTYALDPESVPERPDYYTRICRDMCVVPAPRAQVLPVVGRAGSGANPLRAERLAGEEEDKVAEAEGERGGVREGDGDAEMDEGEGVDGLGHEEPGDEMIVISPEGEPDSPLGKISQLTLAAAIHSDDMNHARRRRYASVMGMAGHPDYASTLPYPADALHIARFLGMHFGNTHRVTAELMKHVVLNTPPTICTFYVVHLKVPVTLAHFKMLARVGRAPPYALLSSIEDGAPFYHSEVDYLSESKVIAAPVAVPASALAFPRQRSRTPDRPRKRPRRSTIPVRSYTLPDSEDSDFDSSDDGSYQYEDDVSSVKPKGKGKGKAQAPRGKAKGKKRGENEMGKWIRALGSLHREETKKMNERRRDGERSCKNDFLRLLGPRLREWRRREDEKARKMAESYGAASRPEGEEDGEWGAGSEASATKAGRGRKRRRAVVS